MCQNKGTPGSQPQLQVLDTHIEKVFMVSITSLLCKWKTRLLKDNCSPNKLYGFPRVYMHCSSGSLTDP